MQTLDFTKLYGFNTDPQEKGISGNIKPIFYMLF